MTKINIHRLTDIEALNRFLDDKFSTCLSQSRTDFFAVRITYLRYWLKEPESIDLVLLYRITFTDGHFVILATLSENIFTVSTLLDAGCSFDEVIDQLSLPCVNLSAPIKLQTVAIPKPWGQEIWYTGIEERGLSSVQWEVEGVTESLALPYYILLAPEKLLGAKNDNITLLKILDPLPEPVYGDLYFELHEEKQEVYVVTHINEESWPDGKGAIRFGFDQSTVAEYEDEAAFKKAYLDSVNAYEKVRREIDSIYDEQRASDNIPLNKPLTANIIQAWSEQLPEELVAREVDLRNKMNSFTHLHSLELGDIVKVPLLTPHALQHGVRTVEFQTPVYERQIISFCQKVLTQGLWDTEEGVAKATLTSPIVDELEKVFDRQGVLVEQVVDFGDFEVLRITLDVGKVYDQLPKQGYQLVMVVEGSIKIGEALILASEEACFVGEMVVHTQIQNTNSDGSSTCLVALPK